MSQKKYIWLSFHLFVNDQAVTESLLAQDIPAFIAENERDISAWFFIRYWEGGPHIRLRLLASAALASHFKQKLDTLLKPYYNKLNHQLTREGFYREHKFDGVEQDIEQLPWFPTGSVVSIAYNREIPRYGGAEVIARSEEVFHISSELATKIIAATGGNISKRFALALQLYLASLQAVGQGSREQIDNFSWQYRRFWRTFVADPAATEQKVKNTYWKAKSSFDSVIEGVCVQAVADNNSIVTVWRKAQQDLYAALRQAFEKRLLISPFSGEPVIDEDGFIMAAIAVVSSQIHMMNNRLGITPENEYQIACYLNLWCSAIDPEVTTYTKESLYA